MEQVENKKIDAKLKKMLFLLAFAEGSSVMALEILVAKMVAPLYGASLYVWASIIGVTLSALAIGYFAGGRISEKHSRVHTLLLLLFAVSLLMALLPVVAPSIISSMTNYSIRSASLLASLILAGLPMLLLGMTPPLIISILTNAVEDSGKTAGRIYAVSTIGGICITMLLGFFVIPDFGIKFPLLIIAIVLMAIALAGFLMQKKYLMVVIGTMVMLVFVSVHFKKPPRMKSIKIREQLESMYGQINIIDNHHKQERMLVINNITQTLVNLDELDVSQMNYVHNLSILSSLGLNADGEEAKALLCGLGGGSILNELARMGFKTDAVEIDSRMPELGERYFNFNKNICNIYIDDARHFIRSSSTVYDLIVIDLLTSEVQPSHVFTVENFKYIKNLLNEKGILVINFQGYIYGDEGKATRSILKTLLEAQYNVDVYFNPDEIRKIVTDIFFIASTQEIDFNEIDYSRINNCCKHSQFTMEYLYQPESFNLENAVLLTDDNGPILDLFNKKANEDWRSGFVKEYQLWKNQHLNVPLF